MLVQMKNIAGGGDGWVSNLDGTVQVKTLALGDTSVTFTNVPVIDGYAYQVYLDMANAATPTAEPPKQKGRLTYTTPSNGVCSATMTLVSAVIAAQVGATLQLRVVR